MEKPIEIICKNSEEVEEVQRIFVKKGYTWRSGRSIEPKERCNCFIRTLWSDGKIQFSNSCMHPDRESIHASEYIKKNGRRHCFKKEK